MKKTLLLLFAFVASLSGAWAQTNLTSGKQVNTLGGLKAFLPDGSVTFDGLQKITVDNNTDNVFLFPENGENLDYNKTLGIQGFYIDLGASKSIGAIQSTWEGADCGANIYVTDTEPAADGSLTGETLIATFSNAQESAKNAAVAVENSGRYLVFVPTEATNYAWGVKIRTFVALEKEATVLNSIDVSAPLTISGGNVTLTAKDQYGNPIASGVTYSVAAGDGTIAGSTFTAPSKTGYVTITAHHASDEDVTTRVFVLNDAPTAPAAANIQIPLYSNTNTEYNATKSISGPYDEKATVYAEVTLGGQVMMPIGACGKLFMGNSKSPFKGWLPDFVPSENNCKDLSIDIYAPVDCSGILQFEQYDGTNTRNFDISLTAGWNTKTVNVSDAVKLHTITLKLNQVAGVYPDVFVTNVFFTPAVVDEDAPADFTAVLKSATATTATFTVNANDAVSATLTYTFVDTEHSINYAQASVPNNTSTDIVVTGLTPSTTYNFSVTAKDESNNTTDPIVINSVTTTALPAVPTPDKPAVNVVSVYSNAYTATAGVTWQPTWEAGSTITGETVSGKDVKKVTAFKGFGITMGQFDVTSKLSTTDKTYIHVDILPLAVGTVKLDLTYPEGFIHTGNVQDMSCTAENLGTWQSYDFRLNNLKEDLTNVNGVLFNGGDGSAAFYVGNIYFYKVVDDASIDYAPADANGVVAVTGTLNSSKLTDFNAALTGVAYDLTGMELSELVTVTPANANALLIVTAAQKASLGETKNMVVYNSTDNRYEGDIEITDQENENIFATKLTLYANTVTYKRANIAADKYITLSIPFTAALPDEDEFVVYYANPEGAQVEPGATSVRFTKKTDNLSDQPYVVHNVSGVAKDLVIAANNQLLDFTERSIYGAMKSVYASKTLSSGDNAYVLQNSTGTAVFKKANGVKIGAFRGYLYTGGDASARLSIVFEDDEATKIGTITAEGEIESIEDGVYYNLNGQRVTNPKHGIYIVNGKKVFVK